MITLEETSLQHNLKEDEASITKKIKRALEKHKDDAEADPVRESEERTKKKLAESEERTKKELADTKQKLTDMEKKIDVVTDMLQKFISKE